MERSKFVIVVAILGIFISLISCVSKDVQVTENYTDTEYNTEQYTETVKTVRTINGDELLTRQLTWNRNDIVLTILGVTHRDRIWYYGYSIPKHEKTQIEVFSNHAFKYPLLREPLIPENMSEETRKEWASIGGLSLKSYNYAANIWVYDVSACGHISSYEGEIPPKYVYPGFPPDHPQASMSHLSIAPLHEVLRAQAWLESTNSKLKQATMLEELSQTAMRLGDEHKSKFIFQFDSTGITELAILMIGDSEPIKSVKLTWTDKIVTEELVTKYRQVPVQVQKQRTVTQTKQIPFWEAIFSK